MYEVTDEQILLILGAQRISKRKIHISMDVFDEGRIRVVSQKYILLPNKCNYLTQRMQVK